MTTHDAVVVGGGIVGSSIAYHLVSEGYDTLLVDREDEGRATSAGAGIVSPATSSRNESPTWFDFGRHAGDYYPELAAALDGYGHSFMKTGLLSVAVDREELTDFERAKRRTERRSKEYGRPRPESLEEVSSERAQELYPPLADVERALYFSNAARVDGQSFATALREAGLDVGLGVADADVTEVIVRNGAVAGVETAAGESIEAETVIIAGGAWSSSFGADLGIEIAVEPKRGQIFHLDTDPVDLDRPTDEWPIVKAFRHQYQVPWPGGRVATGATREADSGFVPHVTLEGLRTVSSEALRIAPGLAEARHLETRVGLRPVSADELPIFGPVPDVEGAYVATGLGPTGLTLGPYTGKVVADLVRGVEPPVDISAFRVDRFSE